MTSLSPFSRSARTLFAAIAVALIIVTSLFWLVRPADAQRMPDVTGTISGRVVDANGQPLAGIEVILYRATSSNYFSSYRTINTHADGSFVFDYLSTRIYRLQFEDPDNEYFTIYYPDALIIEDAMDLLIAGNDITGIEQQMPLGGRIEGQIQLWNSELIDYVEVELRQYVDDYWEYVREVTDASDEDKPTFDYAFDGLQPGIYRVEFTVQRRYQEVDYYDYDYDYGEYYYEYFDNALSSRDATTITVEPGETVADIDAVLGENPSLASISGRVKAPDGSAIPRVRVTALISDTDGWYRKRTTEADDAGEYHLRVLEPGYYKLKYWDIHDDFATLYYDGTYESEAADVIDLTAGLSLQDVNIVMTPTGAISGTVTMLDGETPDSIDLDVYVVQANSSEFSHEHYYHIYNWDQLPEFELTGLRPGAYRLRFSTRHSRREFAEFYDDALTLDTATDVIVAPGEVTPDIDVVLVENSSYATISGTVATEAGSRLLTAVEITAFRFDDASYSSWTSFSTEADENGHYQLIGLTPGLYKIKYSNDRSYEAYYLKQYYDGAEDLETATPISVTIGARLSNFDVSLHSRGMITGTISSYDGRQFDSSVTLRLYAQDDDGWSEVDDYYRSSYDDPPYLWGSLDDGTYRMSAEYWYRDNEVVTFYPDADNIEDATDISVAADTVTPDIDFALGQDPAGARFEGVITSVGVPQPGFHAELYWRENYWYDWWRRVYVVADDQGRFVINGLEEDHYRLCAVDPSGMIAKACYRNASDVDDAATLRLADGEVIDDLRLEMTSIDPYHYFLPIMSK